MQEGFILFVLLSMYDFGLAIIRAMVKAAKSATFAREPSFRFE